jgi:hypothetical protein
MFGRAGSAVPKGCAAFRITLRIPATASRLDPGSGSRST